MQVLDWPSVWLGEGNESTKVPDRASRLDAAYDVPLRQMLVFEAYC